MENTADSSSLHHDSNYPEEAVVAFLRYTDRLEEGASIGELIAQHPDLEGALRELYADHLAFGAIQSDLGLEPATGVGQELPDSDRERLNRRLTKHIQELRDPEVRLTIGDEIGHGGFGVVHIARDSLLRRTHARKVLMRPEAMPRFVEEAQVTAQLSHPGVVPVHDLGIDAEGRPYFSMGLVSGRGLDEVYADIRHGRGDWSVPRALDALLKVCNTVAYAHDRGVVHRDLKPTNVMVGRYGDVFVMDWGLARLDGQKDLHFPPSASDENGPGIESERAEDEPLMATVEGTVFGTPGYMSPEQARGQIDRVGRQTDVYAIGAMLYELLAGNAPYRGQDEESPGNIALLKRVLEGPPEALEKVAPNAPPKLVAVCAKAMRRDLNERYADLGGLADDLRAYLENRVVAAFQAGPWAEAKMWVRRNRPLASALAAALILLIAGLATSIVFAQQARDERDNVFRLSAGPKLDELEAAAVELWPPHPTVLVACDEWLDKAHALAGELLSSTTTDDAGHYARLVDLRARGVASEPKEERASDPEVVRFEGQLATSRAAGDDTALLEIRCKELEVQQSERSWKFDNENDAWWHDQLQLLVRRLLAFSHPDSGLAGGEAAITSVGWGVTMRSRAAADLRDGFAPGGAYASRWEAARADLESHPAYASFTLPVQDGLVPLGPDPDSGLWEFWHVLSGSEPPVADGRRGQDDDSGLVLVLLPGGDVRVGAQATAEQEPFYDAGATSVEIPVLDLSLEPYFISKYELTQGQWLRLTGRNPSEMPAGRSVGNVLQTLHHPVEQVHSLIAAEVLQRFALRLPTEAEWEIAARAGTTAAFWTGPTESSLEHFANLPDTSTQEAFKQAWSFVTWTDPWPGTAPVGSFGGNDFGLFDVAGNVFEWCVPDAKLTGRYVPPPGTGILRGGSWQNAAVYCRIAFRWIAAADFVRGEVGVRPARSVRPASGGR